MRSMRRTRPTAHSRLRLPRRMCKRVSRRISNSTLISRRQPDDVAGHDQLAAPAIHGHATPAAATLYAILVNELWLPYVAGALMQLVQPSIWDTVSPSARALVLARATDLIAQVGLALPYMPICFVEEVESVDYVPVVGLPGPDQSTRLFATVGGGPPSIGNFLLNDIMLERDGGWWRCVQGGSPGLWRGYGVGMAALAFNPRVPWPAGSSSDWYAGDGVTPSAWTLDSGLAVAYPPNGRARITWPNDTAVRQMVAPVTGGTRFDSMLRARFFAGAGPFCNIGFSAAGDLSDLDGIQFGAASAFQSSLAGVLAAMPNSLISYNIFQDWQWFWITLAAGTLTVHCSTDGVSWGICYAAA